MIAALVLAMLGMLLSLSILFLNSVPAIYSQFTAGGSSGKGGNPPPGFNPAPLFGTSTPTPFRPVEQWTGTPTYTLTPTASATATITETPLPPTATETPLPTDTPEVTFPPEEAGISGIIGHAQSYTLDCEARSAVDLADYFGIPINEQEFLDRLPKSDDPDEGFVGNYWDPRGQLPPQSYGVYAAPVAALLREYGLKAQDARNVTWEAVKYEIASGRPVMAWVANNTLPGYPVSYTASNGHTTIVTQYQHTILVIGYSTNNVTILDGDILYTRTIEQFLNSWSVLGYMAIMIH